MSHLAPSTVSLTVTSYRCAGCNNRWTTSDAHIIDFAGTHIGSAIAQRFWSIDQLANLPCSSLFTNDLTAARCFRCVNVLEIQQSSMYLGATAQPPSSTDNLLDKLGDTP